MYCANSYCCPWRKCQEPSIRVPHHKPLQILYRVLVERLRALCGQVHLRDHGDPGGAAAGVLKESAFHGNGTAADLGDARPDLDIARPENLGEEIDAQTDNDKSASL